MTIWKHRLVLDTSTPQQFYLPIAARVLTIQLQDNDITFWTCHETLSERHRTIREFHIFGTGFEFDGYGLSYIGTVQRNGYVWHIFEKSL